MRPKFKKNEFLGEPSSCFFVHFVPGIPSLPGWPGSPWGPCWPGYPGGPGGPSGPEMKETMVMSRHENHFTRCSLSNLDIHKIGKTLFRHSPLYILCHNLPGELQLFFASIGYKFRPKHDDVEVHVDVGEDDQEEEHRIHDLLSNQGQVLVPTLHPDRPLHLVVFVFQSSSMPTNGTRNPNDSRWDMASRCKDAPEGLPRNIRNHLDWAKVI